MKRWIAWCLILAALLTVLPVSTAAAPATEGRFDAVDGGGKIRYT